VGTFREVNLNSPNEARKIVSLIQRNAEFGKRKKNIFSLIDKIEAKVLNENNGRSIIKIDELLSLIKSRVDSVGIDHDHILESIAIRLEEVLIEKNYKKLEDYLSAKLLALDDFFKIYENLISLQNEYLNESVSVVTQKVELELKKIRELRNRLQNTDSENIYNYAKDGFNNTKNIYLGWFFFFVILTFGFAFISLVFKQIFFDRFEVENVDYWVFKITVLSLCLTILSFFLKQVIHYQKKEDFVERISLELNAFPSYISDLDPEDGIKLRKELALKYFGNDHATSNSNEFSSVNVEQMKASTEMVKATTEAIKNLKS